MPTIRLLTALSGHDIVVPVGGTLEVSQLEADTMVAHGYAEHVAPPAPARTAAERRPRSRRSAEERA